MSKCPIRFEAEEILQLRRKWNAPFGEDPRELHTYIADYVNSRLDKLFEGAVEVYACDNELFWTTEADSERKQRALLINVQPISRKVKKSELKNSLMACVNSNDWDSGYHSLRKLWDRIDQYGVEDEQG